MANGVALALAALLLIIGILTARRGLDLRRLIARLRAIQPMPIMQPGPGFRLVQGRLEGNDLLQSPYQGRPCVYYFFRVLDLTRAPKPRSIATAKEWKPATIHDASGQASLEPWTPLVSSPRRFETRHEGLTRIPPHLAGFFERAGIDEKHLARLPSFAVHEYTLEPGDDVYVLGTLDVETQTFVRARRRPYVVSADRDLGIEDALRNELVLYAMVGPLLLAAAAAIAWLGLSV